MNAIDLKYRGARLRQARMSAGLSKSQAVRQFDQRAGVVHPALVRIEDGCEAPTVFQLQVMCAAYGIQPAWLDYPPLHLDSKEAAFAALRDGVITEDAFWTFVLMDYPLRASEKVK